MSERYERFMDAYGRELGRAPGPAPRRRRRLRALVLAGVVLAGAIVAAALLTGTGGSRLDVVAEARAALVANGELLHMAITTKATSRGARSRSAPQTTEQWSTSNPARWRFTARVPGLARGDVDLAYANRVRLSYDPRRDTATVWRHLPGRLEADPPSVLGFGPDPVASIRGMLERGKLRDAGEVTVGGRTLHRLTGSEALGGRSPRKVVRSYSYDVAPTTFEPVHATIEIVRPGTRAAVDLRVDIAVDTFERLPLDADTEKLLTVAVNPATPLYERDLRAPAGRPKRIGRVCDAPGLPVRCMP